MRNIKNDVKTEIERLINVSALMPKEKVENCIIDIITKYGIQGIFFTFENNRLVVKSIDF